MFRSFTKNDSKLQASLIFSAKHFILRVAIVIQLLRKFAHRFTSSLDWTYQMAETLANKKSLGDKRKRLCDFVVVPFDFVPFPRFKVL